MPLSTKIPSKSALTGKRNKAATNPKEVKKKIKIREEEGRRQRRKPNAALQ